MTLRHYQAFVAVCSEGSMSKAAETLYISQSAVSQLIKDLENHYNTRLFYRVSHKLVLTEAGKTLYRHALHMMLYNQSIERDMLAGRGSQVLRIGTNNAMIVWIWRATTRRSIRNFPFPLSMLRMMNSWHWSIPARSILPLQQNHLRLLIPNLCQNFWQRSLFALSVPRIQNSLRFLRITLPG